MPSIHWITCIINTLCQMSRIACMWSIVLIYRHHPCIASLLDVFIVATYYLISFFDDGPFVLYVIVLCSLSLCSYIDCTYLSNVYCPTKNIMQWYFYKKSATPIKEIRGGEGKQLRIRVSGHSQGFFDTEPLIPYSILMNSLSRKKECQEGLDLLKEKLHEIMLKPTNFDAEIETTKINIGRPKDILSVVDNKYHHDSSNWTTISSRFFISSQWHSCMVGGGRWVVQPSHFETSAILCITHSVILWHAPLFKLYLSL